MFLKNVTDTVRIDLSLIPTPMLIGSGSTGLLQYYFRKSNDAFSIHNISALQDIQLNFSLKKQEDLRHPESKLVKLYARQARFQVVTPLRELFRILVVALPAF